ncbi:restriction endonuclease subunit S [Stutzerimonas xanthomarina]|uniref:Restriction endonuclease subunit S n=1 Tax=Stutzerimonas xanthomarina TaxID=271420 RepID=A0A3R8TUQ6_9GAMM|nr:restriction endonuclease subunit S [Stutzerimonas xanthomarina]
MAAPYRKGQVLHSVFAAAQVLKLKRVARLQSGEFITSEAIEEEAQYPVYGGNGLRGYTTAHTHEGEYALVGRQGALCGNINYACGKFWASEHAVVVYPERGAVTRWLGELLRSMNLGQYSVSAAQPGLSVERIADLFIPVPSLIEQTQIARFLDHETARIDALIEEQQRLIELLKEKRQAVISHAVTKGLDPAVPMKHSGVEWLGEVPAHWAVCQVRHLMVGDTRNGLYKPEGEKDPDGVGFVQMGEAFRDRIFQGGVKDRVQASNAELKNWGLEEGDLLFARRSIVLEGSGRCTRVGLLNEPHLFESSMIRIRLDLNRVSPEYLHLMFDSIGMRAQVLSTTKTVTISGIDSGQLKGLRVAVPAKSEQENIAAYLLSRIEAFDDAERAAMETTLLLQERRSALISAAVTGKIDVRGWQPPASTHAPEPAVAEAV